MKLRLAFLAAGLAAGVLPFTAAAQSTATETVSKPAYASDPDFQRALEQAKDDDYAHGHFEHWKQASDLAKGQCVECLRKLLSGEFAIRDYRATVATARQLTAVATDPDDKFAAAGFAGRALMHGDLGDAPASVAQLTESDNWFRAAIAVKPGSHSMMYFDGQVLATLGRDSEAKGMFERFLRRAPENDPRRDQAEAFVNNPHLASRADPRTASAVTASAAQTAAPTPPSPEPAYKSDPRFQTALAAAQERRLPQDEQLARWKKANKVAGNQCLECMRSIVTLQMAQQQWKDAINTATQMDTVATSKNDKFFIAAERGNALLQTNNGTPKPDQLRDAEASLRSALELSPRAKAILYAEGRALAMQGKDADAKAIFARYLEVAGESDRYRTRAEHFTENPHLAAMPMAPPFTLTTTEGEQINLDEMAGKVVLLDFWATWCGPCKQTLPEIHNIAKKFAGQPLVVISISRDADSNAWKQFVASNDMFWPQYRDGNGALARAYEVDSIPRFFTIDSDGVLQSVKVGSGADVEGDLKKLVKRAAQDASRKAAATDKAATKGVVTDKGAGQ